MYTVGEHLQKIAFKPSIHESSHNITLNTLVREITVFPHTHFGSRPNRTPRGTSVLARTGHPISAHTTQFSPEPNTQRHVGSRPNRTPNFRAHNSVLARTEHPEALRFSPRRYGFMTYVLTYFS